MFIWFSQVHGDYSDDIGTKVDRPAEEAVAEEPTEIVGAWFTVKVVLFVWLGFPVAYVFEWY